MTDPVASRPRSPDFLTRGTGDPLPWAWAREQLVEAHDYWVTTVTSGGRPHARPVWGAFVDELLFLSVGAAGFRREDERRDVSVHVDSARDVVIVDGVAARVHDPEVKRNATAAYAKKYAMDGDADWLNFVVTPRVAWGWRDADVDTATKWTFVR